MVEATVVITTRNRREDLRRAVKSAVEQTAGVEVLVMDDASTDGSADMVRKEFPGVKVHSSADSAGYIVRRNSAASVAGSRFVFSLDDDAAFSSSGTVKQTIAEFDNCRIGAVAIPVINPRKGQVQPVSISSVGGFSVVAAFVGTAYAVDRELFLNTGGYREDFFHQGEEEDFCIRMLAAGKVVRRGTADPIHHYESPSRDNERLDLYGRRNNVLFTWRNVPAPDIYLHMPGTLFNALKHGIRTRRPGPALRGVFMGIRACMSSPESRAPVSVETYRLWRYIRKRGLVKFEYVTEKLPELRAPGSNTGSDSDHHV